tara:strand:+ start:2966 stop:3184 length:219 start_codon:yes stop_codon:yes gene_type:complete
MCDKIEQAKIDLAEVRQDLKKLVLYLKQPNGPTTRRDIEVEVLIVLGRVSMAEAALNFTDDCDFYPLPGGEG